jgi:hypothetical protein
MALLGAMGGGGGGGMSFAWTNEVRKPIKEMALIAWIRCMTSPRYAGY